MTIHHDNRWYDSKKVQLMITVTGILISGGLFTFIWNLARSIDETHIVSTVNASPAIEQHFRDIARAENADLTKGINFVIALCYQHMSAAEIERAKGVSGLMVVNKIKTENPK